MASIHIDIDCALLYAYSLIILTLIRIFHSSNRTATYRYFCIGTYCFQSAPSYTGNIHSTGHFHFWFITRNSDTRRIHTCATSPFSIYISNFQRTVNNSFAVFSLESNARSSITGGLRLSDFYGAGNMQKWISLQFNAIGCAGIRIFCRNRQFFVSSTIFDRKILIVPYMNAIKNAIIFFTADTQVISIHVDNFRILLIRPRLACQTPLCSIFRQHSRLRHYRNSDSHCTC